MGNKRLFPVVAVPPAFFGTFFRFERKYFPPRCGSPTVRAGVGASAPRQELLSAKLPYNAACRGFPLAPCTPSVRLPKRINNPTGLYLHSAPESARQAPYQKIAYGKDNV